MARDELILAPESLEALLGGLGEIGVALGPAASGGIGAVRAHLEEALAARQAGQRDRAVAAVTRAMHALAALADALDPHEATAMRAIAARFDAALRHGDAGGAVESVELMRERSGARKKRGDEGKL